MAAQAARTLPIIDISPLLLPDADPSAVAAVDDLIGRACTDVGFFYIVGHGVPAELQAALHAASARFFSLHTALKQKVAMALGGKAWRGAQTAPCAAQAAPDPSATAQGGSPWEMS